MLKMKLMKTLAALSTAAIVISGSGVTAFAADFDASYYAQQYPDVAAAVGNDTNALLNHYIQHGQAEGRKPSASAKAGESVTGSTASSTTTFDPTYYAATYPDVAAAVGTSANALYNHYITSGKAEGRKPNANAAGGAEVSGISATTAAAATYQTISLATLNSCRKSSGLNSLSYSAKLDTAAASLNAQNIKGASQSGLGDALRKINNGSGYYYSKIGYSAVGLPASFAVNYDDATLISAYIQAYYAEQQDVFGDGTVDLYGCNITRDAAGNAYICIVVMGN